MATSGQTELRYTLNEILEEAFNEIQVASQGESLSGADWRQGRRTLNRMLLEWQAQGIHLWTYTEGTLFLQKGQVEYDFGTSRLTNQSFKTRTSAAQTAGSNTIDVQDVSNVTDSDNIGIILSDNTIQWTTVNGSPIGSTVTLTDGLNLDVISGAAVFTYSSTEAFKPVSRLMDDNVRRVDQNQQEIPVNSYNRQQYNELPFKTQLGFPVAVYYTRQDNENTTGTMFVWNAPQTAELYLRFTYERLIEIFGETDGDKVLDWPMYYQEAIIMGLAKRLLTKYGVTDPELVSEIKEKAQSSLDQALSYDNSVTDFEFRMFRWQ